MKNLLFISNLFPNPVEPNMASFNRQQLLALSHHFHVDVIAPVSWQKKWGHRPFPSQSRMDSLTVWHPTYVYTPGILRGSYGNFFYYSIRSRVRALAIEKKIHAIFASWLYPDAWAAAKLAKEFDLQLFIKVHGSDVNLLQPGSVLTKQSLWAVEQASAVFCVSRALKNRLIELGASGYRLQVLYNGVNTKIFQPFEQSVARRLLGIADPHPMILYVGNLKVTKGLGELAEAFGCLKRREAFASCRLVVVGSGPFKEPMQAILQKHNVLADTQFIGSQSMDQVALWMNAANLVCLPSYMEGVPNVILEALSCNTRVVATAVGGIPELDSGEGMLILLPPKDVAALKFALAKAILEKSKSQLPDFIGSWKQNASYLFQRMG